MGENKLIYSGREIVLVTKHKKEIVIKPLLEKETGCKVLVESDFDTDKLGTFSREIKRKKTQHKTALQKIKIGLYRSGNLFGAKHVTIIRDSVMTNFLQPHLYYQLLC